jgi:hypothetical protein
MRNAHHQSAGLRGCWNANKEEKSMSGLDWALSVILLAIYISCVFTVCSLTFSKGYTMLGILGTFFPILWLVGAIMPAKPGSRHDVNERTRYQAQTQSFTR